MIAFAGTVMSAKTINRADMPKKKIIKKESQAFLPFP